MKKYFIVIAAISLCLSPITAASAARKLKTSRADYSKEQQAKFFAEALKLCRKAYGGSLHHVEVNYVKRKYICYHY